MSLPDMWGNCLNFELIPDELVIWVMVSEFLL